MEDGMLASFYGSSLALIIWLFIPFILSYILYAFQTLFIIPGFMLNILMIISQFALEILLIFLLYKQKLRLLRYGLVILLFVGYIFPLTISISVEFGYMIDLEGVIRIILNFLYNVVILIIISTSSALFGGWIGMRFLPEYKVENFNSQQIL